MESTFWIAKRYDIPILLLVLNNGGWNAPKVSTLLVHKGGFTAQHSRKGQFPTLVPVTFVKPPPKRHGTDRAGDGGNPLPGQQTSTSPSSPRRTTSASRPPRETSGAARSTRSGRSTASSKRRSVSCRAGSPPSWKSGESLGRPTRWESAPKLTTPILQCPSHLARELEAGWMFLAVP